jgi:hypothetical protein
MAKWWGDKSKDDKIPEKFRSKTEEEIVKDLEEKDTWKAKAESLEAERAEERKKFELVQTSYASVKAKLDTIEANTRPPKKEEVVEEDDFITNPEASFNRRAKPLATLAAQTAASLGKLNAFQSLQTKASAKNIDARLFQHWDAEIMEIANQTPSLHLAYPNTWLSIFNQVKGTHADELSDPEARKKNYSFLEGGSSQAEPPPEKKTGAAGLTPQELEIARKMKVDPEKYAERKKAMTFVGA